MHTCHKVSPPAYKPTINIALNTKWKKTGLSFPWLSFLCWVLTSAHTTACYRLQVSLEISSLCHLVKFMGLRGFVTLFQYRSLLQEKKKRKKGWYYLRRWKIAEYTSYTAKMWKNYGFYRLNYLAFIYVALLLPRKAQNCWLDIAPVHFRLIPFFKKGHWFVSHPPLGNVNQVSVSVALLLPLKPDHCVIDLVVCVGDVFTQLQHRKKGGENTVWKGGGLFWWL